MPVCKTKQLIKAGKYLYLLISFIIIIGCFNNNTDSNYTQEETIIAKIGNDYNVTLSDLKQYIKDWNYIHKFREKDKIYRTALNDLVTNQLKRFDFFDRKLDQNKDLMSKEMRSINGEIINTYFNKEFVSKQNASYMMAILATFDDIESQKGQGAAIKFKPKSMDYK